MKGVDVFNFVFCEIFKMVKNIFVIVGVLCEEIDYFVFY